VDHEETPIGELETEDLQWDTAGVRPEKDDEIHPAWLRRVERA
jgi:hypothetical protein